MEGGGGEISSWMTPFTAAQARPEGRTIQTAKKYVQKCN